jgi:hypothetical protein
VLCLPIRYTRYSTTTIPQSKNNQEIMPKFESDKKNEWITYIEICDNDLNVNFEGAYFGMQKSIGGLNKIIEDHKLPSHLRDTVRIGWFKENEQIVTIFTDGKEPKYQIPENQQSEDAPSDTQRTYFRIIRERSQKAGPEVVHWDEVKKYVFNAG